MDERALFDVDAATVLHAGETNSEEQCKLYAKKNFAPCVLTFADKDGNYTNLQHIPSPTTHGKEE